MAAYSELVAQAEPARRRLEGRDRTQVAVAIDTSSISSGARETLAALKAQVLERGLDVDVVQVGGNGLSFAYPTVLVTGRDGTRVLYQKVGAGEVPAFVESVLASGRGRERWCLGTF